MEFELQSCYTTSVQTSGTDDSEGHEYRDDRQTTARSRTLGLGGYRVDRAFGIRNRGVSGNVTPTRAATTSHNHPMYTWGHSRPVSPLPRLSRGPTQYGRGNIQYGGGFSQAFSGPYIEHSPFENFGSRSAYDGTESPQSWDDVSTSEYSPPWTSQGSQEDADPPMQYWSPLLQPRSIMRRPRKNVPLN
jgi:hypothetical protein